MEEFCGHKTGSPLKLTKMDQSKFSPPGSERLNSDELNVNESKFNSNNYASVPTSDRPDTGIGEEELSCETIGGGAIIPPDGGYGWVIVFCSFVSNLVIDGITATFGIFLPHMADSFQAGNGQVAWAGSLLAGGLLLLGPIVASLTNKYGCRIVCISGGIIGATGFVISSFANSLGLLLFSYGILGAIGLGLIYLPNIVSVGYYFEKRRAMATGIAMCGSGFGAIAFPPMASWLMGQTTWRNVNLIYAGLLLFAGCCGVLIRPLKVTRKELDDLAEKGQGDGDPNLRPLIPRLSEDTKRELLENGGRGSEFFLVQLPDGTLERRHKLPLTSDSDHVHSPHVDHHFQFVISSCLGLSETPVHAPLSTIGEMEKQGSSEGSSPVAKTTHRPRRHTGSANEETSPLERTGRVDSPYPNRRGSMDSSYGSSTHRIIPPLSRKDVFYWGSIKHLPDEYQDPFNYRHSILNVPPVDMEDNLFRIFSAPVEKPAVETVIPSRAGALLSSFRNSMDFSLLRNPIFLCIAMSGVVGMLGFHVPFVYIIDYSEEKNISRDDAAILISIIGIMNTIGRIGFGLISDSPRINSLYLNNFCILGMGMSVGSVPLCSTYTALIIVYILFGLFLSGFISLTSITLVDLLGLDNLTNSFGLLIFFRGCASIIGSPFAGFLYDTFGSYDIPFFLAGTFLCIASLISSLIPFVVKCCPRDRALCSSAPTGRKFSEIVPANDHTPEILGRKESDLEDHDSGRFSEVELDKFMKRSSSDEKESQTSVNNNIPNVGGSQ